MQYVKLSLVFFGAFRREHVCNKHIIAEIARESAMNSSLKMVFWVAFRAIASHVAAQISSRGVLECGHTWRAKGASRAA